MIKLLSASLTNTIVTVVFVFSTLLTSSQAKAFKDDELVLWVGGDKAYNGIREVGKLFEEDTGIKVKVEIPEKITDRFQQSAASGSGPDILFWAHDRYGEWAKSGLLAPVRPANSFKKKIDNIGWQAMTYNGKIYGYPISLEAISLIYNKDILPEPPASFEEMFPLKDKLAKRKGGSVTTIMWDQIQPYFTMPLLAANGGYVFKQTSTGYDVNKTGVNNAGAMAGAKMLTRLIEKDVLPRGVDYGVMESSFNKGETAMMITGPWAWANLEKSRIKGKKLNYGVAQLPSLNGKRARAFVGVWGATLNNASPNKALAKEFLENYLLTDDGLRTMNSDVPLGAVANKSYMKELKSDPRILATYENAINGLIMPNVPEMGKFWAAMSAALRNITSGRQNYRQALNEAAKQIVN
ncbi:maltose/maltodextrin ABC transporter substrate-binding protein MalE [Endozoicomonas sp. OPT23]|uniref:maltose/maltodextrin ABC transporter substrate-binding protein MalE n=1 Tax=Endozoicomonas sp. OPT23 TaxID=2072845 RepID=UPI00129AB22F|nr:maltose/maltodextrin ABC transporter substrate-binding protein MalE [Endozoicomonas sp. OPT23]MRI31893.1 maltose/maltodextrin ABC transporter substrate-binding protein MalE [Endozoicomonas sp. OPT23]